MRHLHKLYILFCLIVYAVYGYASLTGWKVMDSLAASTWTPTAQNLHHK